MKVALCISGQPRRALDTYPFIYENIIKPNNADVFIHMNFDKNNLYIEKTHADNGVCVLQNDIDEKIIELYKPIQYLIEKPKQLRNPNIKMSTIRAKRMMQMNKHKNWDEKQATDHSVIQASSMYYSIFKCNELKETYANENNFVYDYVIRVRFDLLPKNPIIVKNVDPNFIYYLELGQPDHLISDWINFGSNLIMNVYSSIYFNMEYINTFKFFKIEDRLENKYEPSTICSGMNEHMLRDIMTLFKIPKRAFKSNITLMV
jgi:hypothetical protein